MLQKVDQLALGKANLLTSFFEGECRGTGIVIDRLGRVRDRITLTMSGSWRDDVFRLDETFTHEDGRKELRNWEVVLDEDSASSFTAKCPEMPVPAEGQFTSNTVRMNYRFPVPISGRQVNVKFDDRMYKVDENNLFEKASMYLFGIRVADIYLNFKKLD